jgi:hypothetical protein
MTHFFGSLFGKFVQRPKIRFLSKTGLDGVIKPGKSHFQAFENPLNEDKCIHPAYVKISNLKM